MIITKTCNTCEHFPNDKHCISCEWDKSKGENSKWELKENPVVIERAVLEKIIVEIKEWYWQADKQALAKDPCVVDAMVDLFIRTIDKYKAGK